MNIPDLLNQPWAITPQKLEAMCAVYERHASGVKLDENQIQAAIGNSGQKQQPTYTIQDGVAIVPVQGVLAKKMNIFTQISGGMSMEMLADTINEALADDQAHSLMLEIDSPGGQVDGTQQVANAIAAAKKPTAALIDGLGASAAYWIASQCDSIYAASDTTEVGSIGVVIKHTDQSKANDAEGLKVTHVTAGKYKRIANSDEPLSQDGRGYLQEKVDYIATLFTQAVASGRGVSPETLWSDMGDGKVFFAQQAKDAGLIDGILTQEQVIQQLNYDFQHNSGASASATTYRGDAMKTYTEAQFNEAVAAAEDRGKASAGPAEFERGKTEAFAAAFEQGKKEGITAGAAGERERIKDVEAQALRGHEAIILAAKFDGKTSGAEAAVQVLNAERTLRTNRSADMEADAKEATVAASAPGATDSSDKARSAPKPEMSANDVAAKIKAAMAADSSLDYVAAAQKVAAQ